MHRSNVFGIFSELTRPVVARTHEGRERGLRAERGDRRPAEVAVGADEVHPVAAHEARELLEPVVRIVQIEAELRGRRLRAVVN
jgi:hypothetical protein